MQNSYDQARDITWWLGAIGFTYADWTGSFSYGSTS